MEVADLQQAKWFWTEAIGLDLQEDRGSYIRVGGNGGFSIGLEPATSPITPSASLEITVCVPDVDIATERLRSMGVAIVDGPADQPWGGRHAWLLDPDGRRMSIYSSAQPIMGG